ncbi:glycosyltransferase [Phycicoccus sp. CSK15P-2]|uniref:glycosyltransferase n=1 Tax=Phycicoccus sp. CSK15P-2 TaxID=2807627 RepID=UPI00195046FE|nr:glycosyltransferase [Phycicoccus sp. CSK15P-2]MBM6405957.1 glycosyltransferase [Phycicoccus sp. CSK15P-2]
MSSLDDAVRDGVTVVVPCYRSEETLGPLVDQLLPALSALTPHHEVLLVVDGSPDATAAVAREVAGAARDTVRVIELRRNYGQHNALIAGVAQARYGVTVTMDDDLQHRPDQLGTLLAPLDDPRVDLVYGVPVEEEHGAVRSLASRTVKSALAVAGVPNARDVSAFRAFRTDLREAFAHVTDPFVSLDVVLSWATTGVRRAQVRMDRRVDGESGYTVRRLLGHAANMVTGYSVLPLRLVTWLGLAVSTLGLVALASVLVMYWTGRIQVAGFTTVVAMLSILSGTLMLSLGVVGEYLGRLHVRSMQRPAYVIRPERLAASGVGAACDCVTDARTGHRR